MARTADLTLRRFHDVDAFEERARPFLLAREAEHNLFIGICSQVREGRWEDPYFTVVERDEEVLAAAFRTPPHNLGLSHIADPSAVSAIAEDAAAAFDALPGVLGDKASARSFAEHWQRLTGRGFRVGMEQRIYQATDATDPFKAPGQMRDATAADRETYVGWFRAFHEEVGGIMGDVEASVDLRLEGPPSTGLVSWWHDGALVSMSGWGAPTPNGIRVGPVYTPPGLRGRGYAGSCVAALTARLLEGRRFVFLFTDLANPTSNSIYRKIGYRPICDVDQYVFD
jgi:predicted GNAT family acetyltransferase